MILLVDKIEDGGLLAVTTNFKKVVYNLRKLEHNYYRDFVNHLAQSDNDEHVDIIPCGRFVCIVQQTISMQETFMLFHDCEHSGEKANYISDSLLKLDNGSELKWNFMKAFMLITLNENHDTVELSIEDLT